MLSLIMTSMLLAANDPSPIREAPRYTGPPLQCRELGSAPSRSQAITICRTRAQWMRIESCRNVTRYCAPRNKRASLGRTTAFGLNEDSRVVCRLVKATGTRLTQQQMCLPMREWRRMSDDSQSSMDSLQNRHSTPAVTFDQGMNDPPR